MTHRIGNKDVAQQRSKQDKKEIKAANVVREKIKQAAARARYRNAIKNHPDSPRDIAAL